MSWTWRFLDLGQTGNWTHLSLNYSFRSLSFGGLMVKKLGMAQ